MDTTTYCPSISTSAMLVELSIASWAGRKMDKRASAEITESKGARAGVANVSKKLLANAQSLEAIHKYDSMIRQDHYAMTMPWSHSQLYLLPTAKYTDYQNKMEQHSIARQALIQTFLDEYVWLRASMTLQTDLGDFFSLDDYPTVENLRSKFRFEVNYMPVPEVGDWRVDVASEGQIALREQYEDFYKKSLQQAMSSVWERMYAALSRMSERLDYTGDDDKKRFHDTLVENVVDVVDVLKACNVTNDPEMERMRCELWDAIRGVTPADLRKDASLRRETKRKVDVLIAQLPGLGM